MIYALEREGFANTVGVDLCREEMRSGKLSLQRETSFAPMCSSTCAALIRGSRRFRYCMNFFERLPQEDSLGG